MKNTVVGNLCFIIAGVVLAFFIVVGLLIGSYSHIINFLPQPAMHWKVVLSFWGSGLGFAGIIFGIGALIRVQFSLYRLQKRRLELSDPEYKEIDWE